MRWRAFVCLLLLFVGVVLSSASWLASRRLVAATGLVQAFYSTPDFQDPPTFTRKVAEASLAFLDADPTLPQRMFSVRWEGYWIAQTDGPIEIFGGADDLVRISLDDRLVLERSPALGMSTISETLRLERGAHRLRIDYAQYGGDMRLNVLWAPAGGQPRPLPPESLFPQTPDAALVRRSRLASRLVDIEHASWILAALAAGLLWILPLSVAGLRRLYRDRWIPRAIQQTERWWTQLAERRGRLAFVVVSALALAWTAYARWGGLNPRSLWADDVWLASLTRLTPIWTAMTVPAPAPPGFVGLLWLTARLVRDPEISLQLVPFLCGLVGPLLLGLVVTRVTESRALGLFAIALGLLSPYLANYSVFVKSYSLDFVVTAAFLLLAVRLLGAGEGMESTVVCGAIGALFSLPSVFSSVPLVHLAALRGVRGASRWRTLRWLVAFDVILAAVFFLFLRNRSGPALRQYWRPDFLPVASVHDAMTFVSSHGRSVIVDALPTVFTRAAPLAAVGLVWLLISREWRWFGAMLLLIFGGLLVASGLQLYPIGQQFRGRIDIFSYAPTIALVVVGIHAVTRWLPWRSAVNTLVAIPAIVLVFTTPAPARYFDLDHSDLVRELDAGAQPADAVVLNGGGAYLAGYYTHWRPVTVSNASMQGFGIDFDRPHTLALTRTAGDPSTRTALAAFLADERPARVWFFSTRDDTLPVETVILADHCEEQTRRSSTVSTTLIQYSCER